MERWMEAWLRWVAEPAGYKQKGILNNGHGDGLQVAAMHRKSSGVCGIALAEYFVLLDC